MRYLREVFVVGLLSLLVADHPEAAEPVARSESTARLLNFDSPGQVPGRYIVRFKSEAALRDLPKSHLRGLESSTVLPITDEGVDALATGLARRTATTLTHTYRNSAKGFALQHVSDAALAYLAKDPRVDYIEPVIEVQLLTTQSNPPWFLDRIDQRLQPLDQAYSTPGMEMGSTCTCWIAACGTRTINSAGVPTTKYGIV